MIMMLRVMSLLLILRIFAGTNDIHLLLIQNTDAALIILCLRSFLESLLYSFKHL